MPERSTITNCKRLALAVAIVGIGIVLTLPIFSSTAQQGSGPFLMQKAREIGLAVLLYHQEHGSPPADLTVVELGDRHRASDVLYPDLVKLPADRRDIPKEAYKFRWLYFRPVQLNTSRLLIASPIPNLQSGILRRIVVRSDGTVEVIPEKEFGRELESMLRAQQFHGGDAGPPGVEFRLAPGAAHGQG